MSRRKTRCLTWGEMRRHGSPIIDREGRRVGMIDWANYVTLCGKPDENPKDASLDHHKPRPVGVCPACWRRYRADMYAAELSDPHMPKGFDGEPVRLVVTVGPCGAFIGTSDVIVSHIAPPNDDT